ncbi:TPA: calcium-binding protein [Candidatus Saccharibacteria bacterium]|nr:calcium-binding protein [Candidatus Saccharibacteria bacterium]
MSARYKLRRLIAITILLLLMAVPLAATSVPGGDVTSSVPAKQVKASKKQLDSLAVKGRAPKTNYSRAQFGDGWELIAGCDTRNIILARDLKQPQISTTCKVLAGTLHDPYTGKTIQFVRGANTSDDVQIDHVVALSDAWQKGAQQLSYTKRVQLANDALNLLAVDGPANQAKSDSDAASWLPPNKSFRCSYVMRQIAVKQKYSLWVTAAEKQTMNNVLDRC